MFTRSNFTASDRVRLVGFSSGRDVATFIEYGPDNIACGPNHVSTPGMRIAYVNHPQYGRMPIWERDLACVDGDCASCVAGETYHH